MHSTVTICIMSLKCKGYQKLMMKKLSYKTHTVDGIVHSVYYSYTKEVYNTWRKRSLSIHINLNGNNKSAGGFFYLLRKTCNVVIAQSRFCLFNELSLPTPGQKVLADSVIPLKTNWPPIQSGHVARF